MGEFNATDSDGDVLTYSLVSGEGDDHNSLFTLNTNGTLKTAAVLDYEVDSNLSIRVQAKDDQSGGKRLSVKLTNLNEITYGEVLITGTAQVGQTLSASNTLDDPDGLYAVRYNWYEMAN